MTWTPGTAALRGLALTALFLAAACSIEPRTDRNGAASSTTPVETPHKQVVDVPGVARLPVFSSGVRSGDFIFLSGQIGAEPGAEIRLVEGGIGPETRQAFRNIERIVEAAGGTLADLVKCTVFLADMAEYGAMNEVYLEFFPSDPPARSAFAVAAVPFEARVEIECIAAAR